MPNFNIISHIYWLCVLVVLWPWSNIAYTLTIIPYSLFVLLQPWSNIAPNLDERGRDLLSQMLNLDPMARISARDAMSHPYFQVR